MTFLDGFSETDLRGGGTPPEGGFRTPGGVVLGWFWGGFRHFKTTSTEILGWHLNPKSTQSEPTRVLPHVHPRLRIRNRIR